jgi:hypothetical protein
MCAFTSARTFEGSRFFWLLPFCVVLGALVLFTIGPNDLSMIVYLFVAAVTCLLLLVVAIVRKRLQSLLALLCFAAVSALLVRNYSLVRDQCRWLVWSHQYKVKVLAQSDLKTGDLKHVEWDSWGFAGSDTMEYLVFDPTDSLSVAAGSHQPGKFAGLPCEVPLVRRLERDWYAVRFYTDEFWGRRNSLDCGSGGG